MINGLGGYAAYTQPLVQERLSGQRSAAEQEESRQAKNAGKTDREELFKALLKTASTADTGVSREAVRSDPSQGRGQVLDLNV